MYTTNPNYELEKRAALIKKAKRKDPTQDSFLQMMRDIEPAFESDKLRKKKLEDELAERNLELKYKKLSDEYEQQINDYTDTLTTWVEKNNRINFLLF